MNMRPLFFPLSLLGALLAGCGSDSSSTASSGTPANTTVAVSIPFEAMAGSTPIACGTTLTSLGTASSSATVRDFRYYIHDIRLIKSGGGSTPLTLDQNDRQHEGVAIIDHTGGKCDTSPTSTLGATVTGTVPNDGSTYTGLRFTVGVPEALNHEQATSAASPLNIAALWWSWTSGYKHATLEVQPAGGITRPADALWSNTTFMIHLGSTDCANNTSTGTGSCGKSNRPVIALTGFTPNTSKIRLDYATLVADNKLTEDNGGPSGCMSGTTDPECPDIFEKLGLDLAKGSGSAVAQTAFSVQ